MRQFLRKSVCSCFGLVAYPGDQDFERLEKDVEANVGMSVEEAELAVAVKLKRNIEEFMTKLVKGGMLGEILVLASSMGVLEYINTKELHKTEGFVALRLLRHDDISKRLGIVGYFEPYIQEAMVKGKIEAFDDVVVEDEYAGLNLNILDDGKGKDIRGESVTGFKKRMRGFRQSCLVMVQSSIFSGVMFASILASSVFLCFEPPHDEIEGILPKTTVFSGLLLCQDFDTIARLWA